MKTSIVDYYKGKFELATMDDVVPMFIYVVSLADLTHLQTEINFLEDYINLVEKGLERELRLITNIQVAHQYICHEWNPTE
jgi:hypothetical protein